MGPDGNRTSGITKRVEFLCAAVSVGIAGASQLSDIRPTGPSLCLPLKNSTLTTKRSP
jgi:hypothetical protein